MLLLLLLSRFSRVRLCETPSTEAHQAPLSLGFSRQEHWSGVWSSGVLGIIKKMNSWEDVKNININKNLEEGVNSNPHG